MTWRRVTVSLGCLCAAGAMVWSSLPYLVGYARSSPEWQFGGSFIYPQDGYSYLAKMRQGAAGAWLIHLPYTSEMHAPAPVLMLYPLLGKVAALTGLSFEVIYHLARLAGALALLSALTVFLRAFISQRAWRHLAFALIVVSGGLGWLLSTLSPRYNPLELLAPHLYVFAMLYGPPHVSLGVAVLLVMLVGLRQLEGRTAMGVGLLGAALALIRPETVPIFWGVAMLYWLGRRATGRSLPAARDLVPAALGLPVLAAVYAIVMLNPAFRAWMGQNPFPAPQPLDLALGLAPLLPFGLVGLRSGRWWRGPGLLITLWALGIPLLAYVPIGSQSRLLSGIVVPWGILASYGWLRVVRPALRRFGRDGRWLYWRWAGASWLGGAAASAIWFILIAALYVNSRPADLFYSSAAPEIATWLADRAADKPVLSAWRTGSLLAAQARVKVFLGHPIETLDYGTKSMSVAHFFQGATSPAERSDLLRRYDIGYVVQGPWERSLGAFEPASAPELRRVFAAGDYALYQVVLPSE